MACVAVGEVMVRGSAVSSVLGAALDGSHQRGELAREGRRDGDVIDGLNQRCLSFSSPPSTTSSSFSSSCSLKFSASRLGGQCGGRGVHSALSYRGGIEEEEARSNVLQSFFFTPMKSCGVKKNMLRARYDRDMEERMTSTRRGETKVMAMAPAGGELECLERLSNDHFCQIDPMPAIALQGPPEPMILCQNHVPIYVALPQDTVSADNRLNHEKALRAGLRALTSVGVDGVVIDVWWGAVEREGPKQYDWSAYERVLEMVSEAGMKVRAAMAFHGCSLGVEADAEDSDVATSGMTLPPWIMQEAERNPDVFYTDKGGRRYNRYLSLGVDCVPICEGRSPIQMYKDFMASFRQNFAHYLGNIIAEVVVGLGPSGELKYPAHPLDINGNWEFPGIGEFQCYDKHMLSNLKASAVSAGNGDWGHAGPHDSGTYQDTDVQSIGFFEENNGSWRSAYGVFFLTWYSQALIAHGDRVMAAAASVFSDQQVLLSAKLPRVHWMYKTKSHAAELTAGFYNTAHRDGYEDVMKMIARHGGVVNLSGIELRDEEQREDAMAGPQALLFQLRRAAASARLSVSAENALPRYDEEDHVFMKACVYGECSPPQSSMTFCPPPSSSLPRTDHFDGPSLFHSDPDDVGLRRLVSITFQRMGASLFQTDNWRQFVRFVMRMDKVSIVGSSGLLEEYAHQEGFQSTWNSSMSLSNEGLATSSASPDRSSSELLVGGGVALSP